MKFNFDNSFINSLPADSNLENNRKQVFNSCYSYVIPKKPKAGKLIHVSEDVCAELDLSKDDIKDEIFRKIFTG